MYPPAPLPLADVVLNGADEQAIMYLEKLQHKCPLPDNVIDLNPYQYKPYNLPGGIWYLVCSTEKKKTEFGFWRLKGAASEIFTNSAVSGWKTTLEFIEIQDAREQKTNWVMQEYKITEKGPCGANIEKESRAICRVFLSGGRSSNLEVHPHKREAATSRGTDVHSVASVVPRSDTTFQQGSTSMVLVNNGGDVKQLISEADRHLDPQIRDISELHYILDGDYLELDDLADPLSHSTSSDNSSRSSLTLDEYFDSYALIQELESANNQSPQVKNSNSKFSVTASVKPFEVVMQPATSGSLVCASGVQPAAGCTLSSSILNTQNTDKRVADHAAKKLKPDENKGDSSCFEGVASSSNGGRLMSRGKEKAAVVKMKRLKKCFCLMPF